MCKDNLGGLRVAMVGLHMQSHCLVEVWQVHCDFSDVNCVGASELESVIPFDVRSHSHRWECMEMVVSEMLPGSSSLDL